MKTLLSLAAAFSVAALAANGNDMCCAAPKPQPPPASACCCAKMQKADTAAAQPTLDQLIATARSAKGDELLDALAAVLNKLIDERKGAQPDSTTSAPPQGHQH